MSDWNGRPPGEAAEHTGPHWIEDKALGHIACVVWCHVMEQYHDMAQTMEPRGAAKFWRYLGPALLPSKVAEREAAAWQAGRDAVLKPIRDARDNVPDFVDAKDIAAIAMLRSVVAVCEKLTPPSDLAAALAERVALDPRVCREAAEMVAAAWQAGRDAAAEWHDELARVKDDEAARRFHLWAGHIVRKLAMPSDLAAALAEREERVSGVIADIAAERRRQVEAEGWTAKHDDAHQGDEMALAAACYALPPGYQATIFGDDERKPLWPWDDMWWKPKDRRRDLIRAAALIVAEIERLDRSRGGAA